MNAPEPASMPAAATDLLPRGGDRAQDYDFGFWTTDRIRFCDTDQAGHVNNVAYAAYAETGRVGLMNRFIHPAIPAGFRSIAASVTVNYLRETHYPGEVRIGTGIARIGRTSLTVGQGIFKDDLCVASATGTVVLLQGSTPTPLTDEIRAIAESLLIQTRG